MVRRMVKKHFVFLILAVLCISFISAINTKIDIKTLPNHEVQVSASKAGSVVFAELNRSKTQSDQYGDASFIFSFSDSKYNLYVFVKKDNETVISNKSYDLISGKNQYLELVPEWAEVIETPKANLSDANLSEETNVSTENQTLETATEKDLGEGNESKGNFISSTGLFIIEKGKSIFSSNITYYVIAILAVGVFAFVIRRKFTWPKELRGIKVKKLSDLNTEREEEKRKSNKLKEAEKRLKEAQQEVSRLKNTNRVRELEDRIKEQQEELKKLKNSGD